MSPEGDRHVLAMTNLSKSPCSVTVLLSEVGIAEPRWRDAIGGRRVQAEAGALRVALQPHEVVWLQPGSQFTGGVVDR